MKETASNDIIAKPNPIRSSDHAAPCRVGKTEKSEVETALSWASLSLNS